MANISAMLSGGSWLTLAAMFWVGLAASINPCMGAMAPLVLGNQREPKPQNLLLFVIGFCTTLMLLGLVAARLGQALVLPAKVWLIVLAVLYLAFGFMFLNIKPPVKISVFYTRRSRRNRPIIKKDGLNPALLGAIFGLSPSPCILPVLVGVAAYIAASGQPVFGALALAGFGLGHSLILALGFLPVTRRLLGFHRLNRGLRLSMGIAFVLFATYLLIVQPNLFGSASATHYDHSMSQ